MYAREDRIDNVLPLEVVIKRLLGKRILVDIQEAVGGGIRSADLSMRGDEEYRISRSREEPLELLLLLLESVHLLLQAVVSPG